jgi:hypothetical protein
MSAALYNNLAMVYIQTKTIDDVPKYDPSDTDYLYTRRTVRFSSIINPSLLPSSPIGADPIVTMTAIRHMLEVPRCQFAFYMGDFNDNAGPLIYCPTLGATVDANNGPKPRVWSIQHIDGIECFRVDFEIELAVVECTGGSPQYASHRWKESDSQDETYKITRTRTGRIITRSDINANADSLRGLALFVPPIGLQGGFWKWKSAEFTQSENGLELNYHIQWEQVFALPPSPAYTAKGDIVLTSPNGILRFGEIRVRLTGNPGVNKSDLMGSAIFCMMLKASQLTSGASVAGAGNFATKLVLGKGTMIRSLAIRSSLWEPEVEVTLRFQLSPDASRILGAPLGLQGTTRDSFVAPPYGPGGKTSPNLNAWGNNKGPMLLLAAALGDPCAGAALTSTLTSGSGGLISSGNIGGAVKAIGAAVTGIGTLLRVVTNTQAAQGTGAVTDEKSEWIDQPEGLYTIYQVRSSYQRNPHVYAAPVTKPNDPNVGNADTVFVQLAPQTVIRVVEWLAERDGDKPLIPDPDLPDTNAVFLGGSITLDEVIPVGDGTVFRSRIAGTYVYGFIKTNLVGMKAGVPPMVAAGVAGSGQLAIDPQDFAQGIIDGGALSQNLQPVQNFQNAQGVAQASSISGS